jgi:hypothetical protein
VMDTKTWCCLQKLGRIAASDARQITGVLHTSKAVHHTHARLLGCCIQAKLCIIRSIAVYDAHQVNLKAAYTAVHQ